MNTPAEALAPRNILEIVRMMRPDLRKSDRKVADVVLGSPQRIMNATVAETAEIAEVSQPTVIRFCTAIGCDGFQDFKIRLAQSLVLGTPATQSAISIDDTPDEVAAKIFDYTMTSLDWARHKLDMTQVNEAVALILSARSLEIFGFGASVLVGQVFPQKVPRLGVACPATTDSHSLPARSPPSTGGDVAVAISNTGETMSIVELARLAREQGGKVIAITGATNTALANYSDVLINVETLDNTDLFTPTTSRIAALVAVDIISTLVARRLDRVENQRLVRMKRYLAQIRKNQIF